MNRSHFTDASFLGPTPPGDGWEPIATAPKDTRWIDVWNGKEVWRAHYACDLSGEEQPPFGPGWFYAHGSIFHEVYPRPSHWRPVAEAVPALAMKRASSEDKS